MSKILIFTMLGAMGFSFGKLFENITFFFFSSSSGTSGQGVFLNLYFIQTEVFSGLVLSFVEQIRSNRKVKTQLLVTLDRSVPLSIDYEWTQEYVRCETESYSKQLDSLL